MKRSGMARRCIVLALASLITLAAAEYHGQIKSAGFPLPGVTVTATQSDRTLTAASDQQGVFSFADLPEGFWSLQVEKPGFSPIKQDVTTGANLPGPSFEMKMLPLDEMQTVAPAITSERGTTPAPIPAVTKGKTPAIPTAPQTAFQTTDLNATNTTVPITEPPPEITAELTQRAADGFLINGSAINGRATPFAQSPAFGNARRGGPRLYTYALALVDSNAILDAASYSLTGQHTPKPPFNNMTGTASFGGPIRIPHLLERNGPQFTVNYSRLENRNSRVQTSLMPDAAERAGDFSQTIEAGKPVTISDPTTGQPFANGIIPASRISSQALYLLRFYPLPNFTSGVYNYQEPLIGNTHTDNLRASINKTVKRKNLISALFGMQGSRSDNNSQFSFLDLTHSLGLNNTVSWRRTYTPRFFGTVTAQFSRQSNQVFPFFANRENISADARIAGNNQQPLNWGPPSLQFNQSTIAGLSDATSSIVHNQTTALSYAGAWNHHSHNVSFGGDFRWQQFNTISQSNPRGTFTFSGHASGFDFADFLLGTPDASAIAYGNADKYFRANQPDLYFQDDWRARSGLTLTLGLRWEYTSPIAEKYGRLVNLDVLTGFTKVTPEVANGTIRPDYHEIQPRLGLAWRPFSASSMVVRAGYGISYNTQVYQPFANQMAQQSPLSTSLNVANATANPLTLANGFYAPPNITTNTVAVDPNFKVGYAQVWDLAIQRDLPLALQMVATYTGTKGTHQLQAFAPNTFPTGPINPSGYVYYTSGGNSTRQSGTVQLRRRLHNGLTSTVQYTWSKSIDDAAALGGGNLGTVAQNWQDLGAERGPSTFDQRHLANITLQYTSGMGRLGIGRLLKDWTILDTINAGTGLPLTPIASLLCPETGIPCNVRANYEGAGNYTIPATGQWGNAGRDSISGPNQFSMNASMARAFRLNERFTLNLRLDASNPLNHVTVTQLNTTVTNPLFLLPQQVNAMRTITTTLRLTF